MHDKKNGENLVLVADDDQFIRNAIRLGLSDLCEVIEITDGQSVIDTYTQCQPDILFLDIHIPNINGLELVPKIKQKDPNAYIIMLTSDSTANNVKTAISRGISGFISKPFSKKTLLDNFYRCPVIQAP